MQLANPKPEFVNKRLVLLSGRITSTVLAVASKQVFEVYGVHFRYSGLPRQATYCVEKLCEQLAIPLKIVDLPQVVTSFGFPHKYLLFITYAANLFFNQVNEIAIGVSRGELKITEILSLACRLLNQSCTLSKEGQPNLYLACPYVRLSDIEIVRKGLDLQVDFANLTFSCVNDKEKHCGLCSGCKRRKELFAYWGYEDKTVYDNDKGEVGNVES